MGRYVHSTALDLIPEAGCADPDPYALTTLLAVIRARAVGKDHPFKQVRDEQAQRALFPSNFPPAA